MCVVRFATARMVGAFAEFDFNSGMLDREPLAQFALDRDQPGLRVRAFAQTRVQRGHPRAGSDLPDVDVVHFHDDRIGSERRADIIGTQALRHAFQEDVRRAVQQPPGTAQDQQ